MRSGRGLARAHSRDSLHHSQQMVALANARRIHAVWLKHKEQKPKTTLLEDKVRGSSPGKLSLEPGRAQAKTTPLEDIQVIATSKLNSMWFRLIVHLDFASA